MDRAGTAGVAQSSTKTFSATAVDYNRDGDQDVWIGNHAQDAKLWRSKGNGRYVRVTTSAWPATNRAGKAIDRHDCAWADVDRNGRPDAYCSTGRFRANVVKEGRDNELWLQSRRGTFRDVGTGWGVGDPCGRGRFVAFLDANGDRFPDLFVGNEVQRDLRDECDRPRNGLPNERSKLFLNVRGEGFRYAPRFLVVGAGPGSRCALVLDYDKDGDKDLLLCRDTIASPLLYRNDEQRGFTKVAPTNLDEPVADIALTDLDADGDQDLVTASPDSYGYHLNDGDVAEPFARNVEIGTPPIGAGNSVAAGDADGDGDIDVFGSIGGSPGSNPDDMLWVNDGPGADGHLGFTPLRAPSAAGTADQVTALDPRGSGRASFLVLNGGFGRLVPPGPIQLIRMIPS